MVCVQLRTFEHIPLHLCAVLFPAIGDGDGGGGGGGGGEGVAYEHYMAGRVP